MRVHLLTETGHNDSAYNNLVNYVAKEGHCSSRNLYGASNVLLKPNHYRPEMDVYNSLEEIRKFHSAYTIKYAMHLIVEFAPSELQYLSPQNVLECGYYISQNLCPNVITFFAVHDHSQNLHLDMLIDTVNIYDGSAYSIFKGALWQIAHDIQNMLIEKYMPAEAIVGPHVKFGRDTDR